MLRERLHGTFILLCPGRMMRRICIAEVDSGSFDKLTLAAGSCAKLARGQELFPTELQLGCSRRIPQLMEARHRHTPVGHRASTVPGRDCAELLRRGVICERMQQGHC